MNKLIGGGHCLLALGLLTTNPSLALDQSSAAHGMEPPALNVKGKKFAAGERIEKVVPGVSFVVPSDWGAVRPEKEEVVLLGSKKVTGLGWVVVMPPSKDQDWEQRLNEPMPFMHRLLNPSAKATREKGIWKNTFVDADDPNLIGWGTVLSNGSDKHLIYVIECDFQVKMYCEQAMEQLIQSTRID